MSCIGVRGRVVSAFLAAAVCAASEAASESCVRVESRPDPAWLAEALLLESEHFVVAYYTSGPDSVWHADLPALLLENLETTHRVLSTDPRSRMHVPFGQFAVQGGPPKILAEIRVIEPGYSGLAYWHWPSRAVDAPCSTSADGSIGFSRRIRSAGEARLVAAHELMHLFQYAIDPFEPVWVKESTARWAEEFVFPQDSPVRSFGSLYYHATSLWDDSEQAKVYSPHFWDFLDQTLEATIPPMLWARACSSDWMEALQSILAEYGTNLNEVLHRYAIWNYYTGNRDDGTHYRHWHTEIRPDVRFTRYPVTAYDLADSCAQEAASNYVFFAGFASRADLRVRLAGSPEWAAHRQVGWIGTTGLNTHTETARVDPSSDTFVVPQWHLYDQVAIVVTNGVNGGALPPDSLHYTISAWEEGAEVSDMVAGASRVLVACPNPARGGVPIRFRSTGSAAPIRVAIYDVRGRLVKSLVDGVLPAGTHGAYWDGVRLSGQRAAAGGYVVVLESASGSASRRFVLLR